MLFIAEDSQQASWSVGVFPCIMASFKSKNIKVGLICDSKLVGDMKEIKGLKIPYSSSNFQVYLLTV